jgi:hypothetical protein
MILNAEKPNADRVMEIPIPGLQSYMGLGDAIKRFTDVLRIPQCGGCQERQQRLNQKVVFRPWDT